MRAALTTFVTLYARENSERRDGDRPARAAWAAQRLLVDVASELEDDRRDERERPPRLSDLAAAPLRGTT